MTHNFSAGPAILPREVFEEASKAVLDFTNGLSLLEISHRSKAFVAVLEEAEALAKELLAIPDGYKVLFLTGGASSQFYMTAMNLLPQGGKAAYLDTGTWSAKAVKEAKYFGDVEVVASSKADNYTHVPKGYDVPSDAAYLHVTSNNTVFGNQMQAMPDVHCPLVADMSSDIFSRPIDVSKYDVIYAGAQKNMGPAGVTLVIAKEAALGKAGRDIPTMLDYRTHIAKDSSFNTPPVFPIYVSMLNMRWIKAHGGVSAMQKRNSEKAALLYNEIDRNPCFRGTVQAEDRSQMNATFVLNEGFGDDATFISMCTAANIDGIKGHRSVGGFRASMYNAMDISSVQVLVDVMKDYEKQFGQK
jgi:phosphoserine aminotransferase